MNEWQAKFQAKGLNSTWCSVRDAVRRRYAMTADELRDALPTMFLVFCDVVEAPFSVDIPHTEIFNIVCKAVEDWRATQTDERPPFYQDGVTRREQLSLEMWNNLGETDVRMVV